MERYEIDRFSDRGFSDGSINVNRVLSWRYKKHLGISVDYQGGWFYDSAKCKRSATLEERLLNALRENELCRRIPLRSALTDSGGV